MNESKLTENKVLLEKFLCNRPIAKQYCISDPNIMPFGFIYCIENSKNGKKYIGSTYSVWVGVQRPRPMTALRKRAGMYIYEYNKARDMEPSAQTLLRPIIKAFIDDGFENFIMYPIAETMKWNHIQMENNFIELYGTTDPHVGYNTYPAWTSTKHAGRKQTVHDKVVRSEPIWAVNINLKQIIYADSMKLLADNLGSSKDMMKNSNRKGMSYKGWFLFYKDPDKRRDILINNVLNDQDKRLQDRHSEKAKLFYQNLYDTISTYIDSNDKDKQELFPGYSRLPDLIYKDE